MKTITATEINQWVKSQGNNLNENLDWIIDDQDNTPAQELSYYLSEHNGMFDYYLEWDRQKEQLEIKTDNLVELVTNIEIITSLIFWAYDNLENEEANQIWEQLGLGGDDDVDYHGSYISSVNEFIIQYFGLTPNIEQTLLNMDNENNRKGAIQLVNRLLNFLNQ